MDAYIFALRTRYCVLLYNTFPPLTELSFLFSVVPSPNNSIFMISIYIYKSVVGNNIFKYYFVLFWNNINKYILCNANNTK